MDITKLNRLLEKFDIGKSPLCESRVSQELGELRRVNDNTDTADSDTTLEWKAERMAFDFCEDRQDIDTGWGTYYGPMFSLENDDGTLSENPSIQDITSEIIDYWKVRGRKTKHPVLKARYLGLVWDFSESVLGEKPSHKTALAYIDALIEVADRELHGHESSVHTKLKRAIELSLTLNNDDCLEKAREAVLKYHKSILRDDASGYWSFAYYLLLENRKAKTTPKQEKSIIDCLEDILVRLEKSNEKGEQIDPWKYEKVALPLAEYYRRKKKPDDLERVVKVIGGAFEKASENVEPMLSSAWLQHIRTIYSNYGFKEDASRILVKIKEVGSKVNEDLKSITVEQKIPVDEIDKFVNTLIDGQDLNRALRRVVFRFIPSKDKVAEQVKNLSEKAPLSFMMPIQIQGHKGRVVATIGGIDENLDKHVVLQLYQNMRLEGFFLRHVYEGIHDKFNLTADKIMDFLYESPVFFKDKKEIIKRGIDAYLAKDFLVAAHLLIPQIEDIIRNLFELSGVPVMTPNKEGGYNLLLLGKLFSHQLFREVFGENVTLYFRVLFTDSKGWNLRNDLCHGLMMSESLNQQNLDRVIHALLCLAIVRKKETE